MIVLVPLPFMTAFAPTMVMIFVLAQLYVIGNPTESVPFNGIDPLFLKGTVGGRLKLIVWVPFATTRLAVAEAPVKFLPGA